MQHVLVLGGGICGLASALGLARAGRHVTVVDREPPPPTSDPEEAFAKWTRASVPQAPQGHFFYARTRSILYARAPDVLERLVAWGALRQSTMDLAPPETRLPEDEALTGLRVRRLPFELILRQTVESEHLVDIRCGDVVDDLVFADGSRDIPRVSGVRLRNGRELVADIVIDASGRKTRVPESLERRDVRVRTEVEDCYCVYFGRQFRMRDDTDVDPERDVPWHTLGGDLGYLAFASGFTDHGTLGMWISTPPWDDELKTLRDVRAWDAAARSFSPWAHWIHPDNAVPITPVMPFAGQKNVLRYYLSDGRPIVHGLLPAGDALSMTNPNYGWGASLALTHAFAAVDAICSHNEPEDIVAAYHAAVLPEAEDRYRQSATADRLVAYRRRGVDVPDEDRLAGERDELVRDGLGPAMWRDFEVLRAMSRRGNLVDPPDAIWANESVLAKAREVMAWRRAHGKTATAEGPEREELLAIMGAAMHALPP